MERLQVLFVFAALFAALFLFVPAAQAGHCGVGVVQVQAVAVPTAVGGYSSSVVFQSHPAVVNLATPVFVHPFAVHGHGAAVRVFSNGAVVQKTVVRRGFFGRTRAVTVTRFR